MTKGHRYASMVAFGLLLAAYAVSTRYNDWAMHQVVKRQAFDELVLYVAAKGREADQLPPVFEYFNLPADNPTFRYFRGKDAEGSYLKTFGVRKRGNDYDVLLAEESGGRSFYFLIDKDTQLIKAARQTDGGRFELVGGARRFTNELTFWRCWWDRQAK